MHAGLFKTITFSSNSIVIAITAARAVTVASKATPFSFTPSNHEASALLLAVCMSERLQLHHNLPQCHLHCCWEKQKLPGLSLFNTHMLVDVFYGPHASLLSMYKRIKEKKKHFDSSKNSFVSKKNILKKLRYVSLNYELPV